MKDDRTRIDDIITVTEERKTQLLGFLDNYARMPGADLVAGVKHARQQGICKTEDELVFLAFMFGSVDGSKLTVDNLAMIGDLVKDLDTEGLKKLTNKVGDELDEIAGKKPRNS